MSNCIIYARVSSKEQEKEGYSIPAQLKLLNDYAQKQNLIVVNEFIDIETAKREGRTNFNKLISFLQENNDVKILLVEKTDRLLRNIKDYAIIDELIERHHVTIHLVKENEILSKDSRSHQKFIFGIKALMAKNYVDNLGEEAKKGMLEKAEQGIYPSLAPVGYKNVRNENGKTEVVLDPDNTMFIRRMFELYATGNYSLSTLRDEMIQSGFQYRNGRNFHKSTVETILKNEFYTGVFYWKGIKYEHAQHPAIVSNELFHKVQSILLKPNKPKSKKGMFAYTNFIKCGYCNSHLTAEIKKEKYIYYRCSQHGNNHGQPFLREEYIENEFAEYLKNIKLTDYQKEAVISGLKESHKDKIEYHNTMMSNLNELIKRNQTRIDNMYIDKLDGKISEEFWQQQHNKLQKAKDEAVIKLEALQKTDHDYFKNAELILELSRKAYGLFFRQSSAEKRKLLNLIVSEVSYNGSLHIKLKAPFDKVLLISKSGNMLPESDSFRTIIFRKSFEAQLYFASKVA